MKKYNLILMMILIICIMTSCGVADDYTSTTGSFVSKAGTVQLYHASDTAVVADEERYQLMQPDNLSAALEEVIEEMQINDKMTIEKYLIDENRNITLFIVVQEGLTKEELLLNRAAIVRSIKGLDTGDIGISMTNEEGVELERATYTDASFYYYED